MKLFWSRHKPSVLETCPPEICQQIFQLACLDGGFTGRSLSLVSRYIHSSAASVRYQSISVEGLDQILALTSILKVKEIQHRRVHHLFLSHCPPPRPYPPRTRSLVPEFFATVIRSDRLSRWARQFTSSVLCKSIPLGPRRVRTTGSREEWHTILDYSARILAAHRAKAQIIAAAVNLFAIISGSLETLSMVMPQSAGLLLPPSGLSALKDLTIYSVDVDDEIWKPGPSHPLPCLERLHVIGPLILETRVKSIINLAPSLTHVRFSGLEYNPEIARMLKTTLDIPLPSGDVTSSHPHRSSPPRLLIQARPPQFPLLADHLGAFWQYSRSLDLLRAAIQSYSGSGIIVFLKPEAYSVNDDAQVREAKRFWQATMVGQLGCWDETTRYETLDIPTAEELVAIPYT